MSTEAEIIAEAAQRFAQALQAERASTVKTLADEREAAQQLLRALRQEYGKRQASAGLSFLSGVVIGAAVGVAVVALLAPRSGSEQRSALLQDLTASRLAERWRAALDAGKRDAAAVEAELWQAYRRRIAPNESA
jgi:hypothetical protein